MQTQQNLFIRKWGKWAIIITVTDWEDFKELADKSEHENPDLLLSSVTSRNIYTNMNPSVLIATRGEVKDITDDTKGLGLQSIITGNIPCGPIWSFRKIDGLCAVTEMITPKL